MVVARRMVSPYSHRLKESIVADRNDEPPFTGGSQPVPEHVPEPAGGGRTVAQTVVIVVGVLVVLAGILWLVVPFGAS